LTLPRRYTAAAPQTHSISQPRRWQDTYAVAPAGGREGRPSPYTGGIFRLSIKLDDTYPANPPAVKFLTRVWHPNIHLEDGKPCADALREAWKPTWSLRDVLSFMRDLLAAPNGSDCVNSEAGRELLEGVEVFDKHAAEETSKYAKE